MNILVLAAHPDDEVLGCGASLARWAREGHRVHIAILGEGVTSRAGAAADEQARALARLREDAHAVAELLGACAPPRLLGLPDNRFDTLPLLEIAQRIEALVAELAPERVCTHSGGDLNVDHAATFRAALTALRPMAASRVRELYTFEVPSATEWAFGSFAPRFEPNTFVDVGATLELKVRAMQCYEAEARAFPHPRSPEALRALAAWRGAQAGLPAAEALQLVWRRA